MHLFRTLFPLMLAAAASPAASARGQDAPPTTAVILKPGSVVQFTTRDGHRVRDRLRAFTSDSLLLSGAAYPLVQIDTVWQRHHRAKTGAKIGAIIGGVSLGVLTGVAAGTLSDVLCETQCHAEQSAVLGGLLGGGVGVVSGGLLGGILGSAFTGWRRVYPVSARDGGAPQR